MVCVAPVSSVTQCATQQHSHTTQHWHTTLRASGGSSSFPFTPLTASSGEQTPWLPQTRFYFPVEDRTVKHTRAHTYTHFINSCPLQPWVSAVNLLPRKRKSFTACPINLFSKGWIFKVEQHTSPHPFFFDSSTIYSHAWYVLMPNNIWSKNQ